MKEETKNNIKELQEKIIDKMNYLVEYINESSLSDQDVKISGTIKKLSKAYKNITKKGND